MWWPLISLFLRDMSARELGHLSQTFLPPALSVVGVFLSFQLLRRIGDREGIRAGAPLTGLILGGLCLVALPVLLLRGSEDAAWALPLGVGASLAVAECLHRQPRMVSYAAICSVLALPNASLVLAMLRILGEALSPEPGTPIWWAFFPAALMLGLAGLVHKACESLVPELRWRPRLMALGYPLLAWAAIGANELGSSRIVCVALTLVVALVLGGVASAPAETAALRAAEPNPRTG